VHLHVHTEYSLLDGLSTVPKLIERVFSHKQRAVAITDHGVMYGAVKFYLECREMGVKPIIGVEAYMSEGDHLEKQIRMGADQYHLTVLAKNQTGYQNLLQLVSLAHLEGFSYKPRIDFNLLAKFAEGLVVTSGCPQGLIPKKLAMGEFDKASQWVRKFHEVFGKDFYIEIQRHPKIADLEKLQEQLIKLARETGIALVATNDVHYVDADDAEAQDALLAVQMRKTIADKNRLSMLDSPDFYLKSSQEMASLFAELPDAIENSVKIADECEVNIPVGKMIFPKFPLPAGETNESYLRKLTIEGARERFGSYGKDIKDRLDYELKVICDKGFATYFLIVADFVNWAKSKNIRVGPGRGSAAGSLVSYVRRITSINPLDHNLPFERFLNPERPSPPDIDIDIADERRDEVIRYVAEKYGEDHVAQIITFGTMEARASVRDIGRVLGMPFSEPDKIAKLIPLGYSIEEALTGVFELQEFYKDPKYKKLIDLAKKVEGLARHASTHAAGVVIADKPLTWYTPIQRESRAGKIITQYDMYDLDLNISEKAIGLLKIDFLGLRNLSILGRAVELVAEKQGKEVDLSSIPLDDDKVFTMLSNGETTGVFQLESAGMRRVAKSLKPERFSDITAMVALFRPGPMELISDFIDGKHNPERVKYPHPDLKPILEETYGIPVYQEQVLQIANLMAGYSLGEADLLRRAIGKKKRSLMVKEQKKFIAGAQKKGYTKKIAETIWSFIEKFVGYGFNKAHSASYAMIAYQTAYMKVNYPLEYMAAFLTIESQAASVTREEKLAQAVEECRRMGIRLLPPDINRSHWGFAIESSLKTQDKGAIRFGLSAVKNAGGVAVETILSSREKGGLFTTLTDFCSRVDTRKANKKVIESLIRVGAMDQFGKRSAQLAALDTIRQQAALSAREIESGQAGLFEPTAKELSLKDPLPEMDELPQSELLAAEKELLGLYLTEHPMAQALSRMHRIVPEKINEVIEATTSTREVRVGGVINRLKRFNTKNNNGEMAFVTIEDESGSLEMVVFPRLFEKTRDVWQKEQVIIAKGKLEERDGKHSLVVASVRLMRFEGEIDQSVKRLTIPRGTNREILETIGSFLKKNPGKEIIEVEIPNGDVPKVLRLPYTVNYSEAVQQQIKEILAS